MRQVLAEWELDPKVGVVNELLGTAFVMERDDLTLHWPRISNDNFSYLLPPDNCPDESDRSGVDVKDPPEWGNVVSDSGQESQATVGAVLVTGSEIAVDEFKLEPEIDAMADLRSGLMTWTGVVTGQASGQRWRSSLPLKEKTGITLGLRAKEGPTSLSTSLSIAVEIGQTGGGVGALALDLELLERAYSFAENPVPLECFLFQGARTAMQYREHALAVLEMAMALEVLLWDEYTEKPTPASKKNLTLGQLAAKLGYPKGSPTSDLVDLRNRITHHPDQPIYHNQVVTAFETALAHFKRRHPAIYLT